MMASLCKDETIDQKWLILDGPVDTLWIESMNTVLDDNKVLTLLNDDRISLPPQMGLIFEVENLAVASPATTVQRVGMVYLDINDLGWRPHIESWVENLTDPLVQETIFEFTEKWTPKLFKQRKWCKEIIPSNETNMNCFFKSEKQLSMDIQNKSDVFIGHFQKNDLYLDQYGVQEQQQMKMVVILLINRCMILIQYSLVKILFMISLQIVIKKNDEKLGTGQWISENNSPYHKMLVPTTDQVRNNNIITGLLRNKNAVLAVGLTGLLYKQRIIQILFQIFNLYQLWDLLMVVELKSQQEFKINSMLLILLYSQFWLINFKNLKMKSNYLLNLLLQLHIIYFKWLLITFQLLLLNLIMYQL